MGGFRYRVVYNATKANADLQAIYNSPHFVNHDPTVKYAIKLCFDAFTVGIKAHRNRQAVCEFIAVVKAANEQGITISKYDNSSKQVFYYDRQGIPDFRVLNHRFEDNSLDASARDFVPSSQASSDSGYGSASPPGTPTRSPIEITGNSKQQEPLFFGRQHIFQRVASLSTISTRPNVDFSRQLGQRGERVSRFASIFEQRYPGYIPAENISSSRDGVGELQLILKLKEVLGAE